MGLTKQSVMPKKKATAKPKAEPQPEVIEPTPEPVQAEPEMVYQRGYHKYKLTPKPQ